MSTFSSSSSSSSPTRRPVILGLFFLVSCFLILFFTETFRRAQIIDVIHLQAQSMGSFPIQNKLKPPSWFEVIHEPNKRAFKVGMVNVNDASVELLQHSLKGFVDSTVTINLESVSWNVTWKDLFPRWSQGDMPDECPDIPMPEPNKYLGHNVIVAHLPCREVELEETNNESSHVKEGLRDVERLQVSLATARLIVENEKDVYYAVFVGKCEPMLEIFRCHDLVWHKGEYWVYKPNVDKLREVISMPVGTCAVAHPYTPSPRNRQSKTNGNEHQQSQVSELISGKNTKQSPRHAYVTLLHSSEKYVCGAIVLAQSLRRTNTNKDLVLLVDASISNHSLSGLQAAGWTIKRIDRIESPFAKNHAYNKWNYSKLRIWQLTEYDKIMFVDSDFIVLRNIDHFFGYPQLSGVQDMRPLFNSGLMIVEPSECFFDMLMRKRYTVKSYNGGDQGYLNEVVTWWHRLTARLEFLKLFSEQNKDRSVLRDRYTIHMVGMKPWTCYRDYDCNWDVVNFMSFASDDAHALWWQVHDGMPVQLQMYCRMTKKQDKSLRIWRERAEKANFTNGRWKIDIKDPRQFQLVT